MARRVVLWKRADSHTSQIRKNDSMAIPLTGTRSEYEVSPAAKQAASAAMRLLQPHSQHFGSALGELESVANPDTSYDPSVPDADEGTIEKAMADLLAAREQLKKKDLPSLREATRKAERAGVEQEYLRKHSGAWTPEREAIRKRGLELESGGSRVAA